MKKTKKKKKGKKDGKSQAGGGREPDDLITVKELSGRLRCTPLTIYRHVEDGTITEGVYRLGKKGGAVRFKYSSVLKGLLVRPVKRPIRRQHK